MPVRLPATAPHPHARAVLTPTQPPGGTPSHAYLFHGPAGTGKRAAARQLAVALLTEGAPDPQGAGERVRRGAHPDLTWVTPSGAHELLVGDVDEAVVAAAARTPFEARRRVFVLERVDTLIEPAANRLLKTLEEPPAYVHLILLTDHLGEVLPTIASRCQHVRFDPLPPERIAARLREHGVEPPAADACARLALGDADRALALATSDGPKVRAEVEALAGAARTGRLEQRPWKAVLKRADRRAAEAGAALAEAWEDDKELLAKRDRRRAETEHTERTRRVQRRARTRQLDLALQLTGLWFRDLAAVGWGAQDVAHHADRLDVLRAQAEGLHPQRARAAVELVEDARESLTLNVSEKLACEALAYRLARELAAA